MSALKEILTHWPLAATIRLTLPARGAKPGDKLVSPVLGFYKINVMAFKDRTFEFIIKPPSVTW